MLVTIHNFKKILIYLKQQDIHLKVKTNAGWTQHYLHLIGFIGASEDHHSAPANSFRGIVLSNTNATEGILINNINTLTAFKLQKSWGEFQAETEYPLQGEHELNPLTLR
jgi:hypothetical protein